MVVSQQAQLIFCLCAMWSVSSAEERRVRWGIMGTGTIANDFVRALQAVPQAEVAAIGSRTQERAAAFADSLGLEDTSLHGSYEALLADETIDIIYIATPSSRHVGDAIACLVSGRAVLCEKSMAPSASEAARVLQLASDRNLFFLHGVWSRFFPAYAEIRRLIDSGVIGEVRSVQASFCQNDGAGACSAMAETGIYCAQFLLWACGGVAPEVKGVSFTLDPKSGLDTHVAALLEWPSGAKGSFECSLAHPSPRSATICGTKGVIETFSPKSEHSFTLPEVPGADQLNFVNSQGLVYEAAEATRCVLARETETPLFSSSECLLVMQLISDIRSHWSP